MLVFLFAFSSIASYPPSYSSRLSSDSGALVEPEPANVLLLFPRSLPVCIYACVELAWQRRHRVEIHEINCGLPPSAYASNVDHGATCPSPRYLSRRDMRTLEGWMALTVNKQIEKIGTVSTMTRIFPRALIDYGPSHKLRTGRYIN